LQTLHVLVFGILRGAQRSSDFPKALPQEEKTALTDFREELFASVHGIRRERVRFGQKC
jgi:hypothetical protein